MDDIRDMQTGNFFKFLDTDVRTNPFGENRSAERAYRRAERLVAAIFLLTNHVDPREPVRHEIRSSATALLQKVLDLRDEMRSSSSRKIIDFQAAVRHVISQVHILVFAGLISSQNAEVVVSAFDELGNFITLARRTNLSESVRISREELLEVRAHDKGQIKDIKDKLSITDSTRTPIKSPQSAPRAGSSARGMSVVEILRAGGDLNIRDIAANLPEYGEKTIQRELASLIERGIVRRTGLKRWSRYSLA